MKGQSTRPQTLNSSTDYYPALLWLMGELEQAQTSEAIAEFERRMGELIPHEHRELNASGSIKWEHYVRWSRQALVNAGLMGSAGRGIWTITQAGKQWLQDHPDGSKAELMALIRQSRAARKKVAAPAPKVEPQSVALDDETPALSQADDVPAPSSELTKKAFFKTILTHLTGELPPDVCCNDPDAQEKVLQLTCPARRSHYEIYLRKRKPCAEMGLHFEGRRKDNWALLDQFRLQREELEEQVGEPIFAEPWREGSSWTRVVLKRPYPRLDVVTAKEFADVLSRFIQVTLPVLRQAVADMGLRVGPGRPPAKVKEKDLARPKTVLAQTIRDIRAYLKGDRALSPSDDKLCEWVQFCYNFELFDEGAALFQLVRRDEVHPWLYKRTQKLARACEVRLKR